MAESNEYGVVSTPGIGFGNFVDDDVESMYDAAIAGGVDDESQGGISIDEHNEPIATPDNVQVNEPQTQQVVPPEPVPAQPVPAAKPSSFIPQSAAKLDENVEMVTRILRAADTYRELDRDSQSVAAQFICNRNDIDPNDEVTVVVNALGVEEARNIAMKNLVQAYNETERVDRLYYLLRISQKELNSLGSLVELISDDTQFNNRDKIVYAKELEEHINKMDTAIIDYVSATQKVLEAASPQS